jgi:hypothetical protein
MTFLKEKIVEKIEDLPENLLQEILDFVNFLEWRKETRHHYEENKQRQENSFIDCIEGVLVVKAQSTNKEGMEDINTLVHDLRDERIRKFTNW